MKYHIIPVTAFTQNCSIIWCEKTLKAAIIDPGGDVNTLIHFIEKQQLQVDKILLTHGHLDHVGGTAELKRYYQVAVIGPHKDDKFLIQSLDQQSAMFQFPQVEKFTPDQWLEQNHQVHIGELTLDAIHCPGHTPGHIVFIEQQHQLAFVGDVLFRGAIGRTDFPRGNHQQLLHTIKYQLWTQDSHIEFIPGHGSMSNFAHERRTNPYVADELLTHL